MSKRKKAKKQIQELIIKELIDQIKFYEEFEKTYLIYKNYGSRAELDKTMNRV